MISDLRVLDIINNIDDGVLDNSLDKDEQVAYLKYYIDLITTQLEYLKTKATKKDLQFLDKIKKEME